MFLPDPISVLRSIFRLVRPGGAFAFQEPSWTPGLALGTRLPLWSKVLVATHETLLRSGANPEMGLHLHRIFQEVGLPAPAVHMETLLGSDPDLPRLHTELLCSVHQLAQKHNIPLEDLGDLETLSQRVAAELAAANTVTTFIPIVSAWSRKPEDEALRSNPQP